MKYEITDESIEKALAAIKTVLEIANLDSERFVPVFKTFSKSLCIPVEPEGAGWVLNPQPDYPLRFEKNKDESNHAILKYNDYKGQKWVLCANCPGIPENWTLDITQVSEAQAWADAKIREYEAKQLPPSCDYCEMDLPAQYVLRRGHRFCDHRCEALWFENHHQPKPFGPGTRLVTPNGDKGFLVRCFGCLRFINETQLILDPMQYFSTDEIIAAGYRMED